MEGRNELVVNLEAQEVALQHGSFRDHLGRIPSHLIQALPISYKWQS
jgi:hypothetical protein